MLPPVTEVEHVSSLDGLDGPNAYLSIREPPRSGGTVDGMLFESLVHHLLEKGVLTKNDALSVVQTVAQVKRGELDERGTDGASAAELAMLKRLYNSFEALADGPATEGLGGDNVRNLRPPLHGERPEFPLDD